MTTLVEILENPRMYGGICSAPIPLVSVLSTGVGGQLPFWTTVASGEIASDPELEFQGEKTAFQAQLPILKGTLAGKYVAIHNGEVVETGSSEGEVVRQFFERFGDTHVYIGYVGDTVPATYQVSPFSF